LQKTLYLFANGRLRRKDNTIYVEGQEGRRYFPVASLRDVFIFGEIDLNKKVLEFMAENEVVVHFFGYYGNYVGSFYPREHYNSGYVILRQAECYLDPKRRLELARKFVEGALANILQVLRYYDNRGKKLGSYIEAISEIAEKNVPTCRDIEDLMAVEGNARKYYYQSFNDILAGTPFSIEERTKRPPTSPMNALISFGNALIYGKVLTEIYKTHLDPRIGYLHATNFRRFSLNLDVAEIFKPIFADRILFMLASKKMIGLDDFERRGTAYFLKERGKRLYITKLEEKLKSTFFHRSLRRNISYQTLIRLEIYKIQKHVMGEQPYKPFVSRW